MACTLFNAAIVAVAPSPGAAWHVWLTAGVMVAVVCGLIAGVAADMAMLGALVVLLASGVLTTSQAASGFANEGLLSVAALYIVAAGLQNTGAVRWAAGGLLRPASSTRSALLRMCPPVALLSAFVNNTPIVAFMMAPVQDWARRSGISASKLLIPLSYATILGGTITIIGTSTNLVVVGLVQGAMKVGGAGTEGLRQIGFFELAWVGVPLALLGLAYIVALGPRLLPARQPVLSADGADARSYTTGARVTPKGPLDGRTIEKAGLRHLPGLFIVEIIRGGEPIPAPPPTQVLRGDDRLVFAGVLESVVELRQFRGLDLEPADSSSTAPSATSGTRLVEAVVSDTFPGIGTSIRDFGFRRKYDAAVVAVARNGARVPGRLGDVALQAGDTLLLDAHPSFADRNRNSRDFYLVGALNGAVAPRHDRAWVAVLVLIGMILAATQTGDMLIPSFVAAGAMLLFRCVSVADARGALDLTTLLVIAASLGLSRAIEGTGLGATIGQSIVDVAGGHPIAALAAVYAATMFFTAFASNSAAAAIMFPVALGTAATVGGDPMPYVLAILFAASADFATPIGYQTNLMVCGPGGYRFADYLRIGAPLNAIALIVTVVMLTLVYHVGGPAAS